MLNYYTNSNVNGGTSDSFMAVLTFRMEQLTFRHESGGAWLKTVPVSPRPSLNATSLPRWPRSPLAKAHIDSEKISSVLMARYRNIFMPGQNQ